MTFLSVLLSVDGESFVVSISVFLTKGFFFFSDIYTLYFFSEKCLVVIFGGVTSTKFVNVLSSTNPQFHEHATTESTFEEAPKRKFGAR